MNDAVCWLSTEGRLASDPVPQLIAVDSVTDNGPWHQSLRHIAPVGSANDVLRVAWVPDGGSEQQLLPNNRANLDRTRKNYMTQSPGTPEFYWVEGGSLMVWPAFASSGSLSLMLGTALWKNAQNIDGETIDLIPYEYQPLVVYKAVVAICGQQPEDDVLKQRAIIAQAQIDQRFPTFLSWAQRRNRAYQPHMKAKTGRRNFLTGRR